MYFILISDLRNVYGVFEKNGLLFRYSISTWNLEQTNTYLYSAIQYLHNDMYMCP